MKTPDFGNSPELKRRIDVSSQENPPRIDDIQIYMGSIDSLKKQEEEMLRNIDTWKGSDRMRLGYEEELEGIRKQIKETEEKINNLRN